MGLFIFLKFLLATWYQEELNWNNFPATETPRENGRSVYGSPKPALSIICKAVENKKRSKFTWKSWNDLPWGNKDPLISSQVAKLLLKQKLFADAACVRIGWQKHPCFAILLCSNCVPTLLKMQITDLYLVNSLPRKSANICVLWVLQPHFIRYDAFRVSCLFETKIWRKKTKPYYMLI